MELKLYFLHTRRKFNFDKVEHIGKLDRALLDDFYRDDFSVDPKQFPRSAKVCADDQAAELASKIDRVCQSIYVASGRQSEMIFEVLFSNLADLWDGEGIGFSKTEN